MIDAPRFPVPQRPDTTLGPLPGPLAQHALGKLPLAALQSGRVSLFNISEGYGNAEQRATQIWSNTYTGPTTVNAGTLRVTGSIAQSAVTVNDAAAFEAHRATPHFAAYQQVADRAVASKTLTRWTTKN